MCMKKWVCILILFSIPLFSIIAYINCGAARNKDLNALIKYLYWPEEQNANF